MNCKLKTLTLLILCLFITMNIAAQKKDNQLTQVIRGIVKDRASGGPLAYASVGLPNMPETGTTTDEEGVFILNNVPIGRHTVQVTLMGYEPTIFREILVTSSKEVYLEIPMKENVKELNEVVVTVQTNKSQPINEMATTGARMLSVEEASRYAGGMDDPARLVGSFAGVASPSISSNGISIHGNAPHLLQWRLEDVEIPNPNHFADISTLGGGVLSSLSSHVLGNSDFFTGAFPAEYNNAVSGVFDMKLRNGNNRKYENTFQLGILGIDFASEGPFSKKHNASYIFNYRYSTTALLNMDEDIKYQDLNFKLNFPTRKAGVFSLWGTALIDDYGTKLEDVSEWETTGDQFKSGAKQNMASVGLSHRYFFGDNSLWKTSLAITYFNHDAWVDEYDQKLNNSPYMKMEKTNTNLVFTTSFNKKYSRKFTNKIGLTITKMYYDMYMDLAPYMSTPMDRITEGDGSTELISAYNSSTLDLNDKVTLNFGVDLQHLALNKSLTLEPRVGIKWRASNKSSFALAYGLHSRMEKMDVYFAKTVDTGDKLVNKDLGFTKAHHIMLTYNYKISDDMNIRIEPYYQRLFNVPVIADSAYSVLNRDEFYVKDALVNKGKGRNIGVDITFEKYLTKGLYYMITGSLFDSKYCGGDGKWHDTKFNRKFILNTLVGKEWTFGANNQNTLGVNLKLTYQGGDRYSPIDEEATMNHPDKEVQYDLNRAYSKKYSPMFVVNGTISYRINKKKMSHEFAVKAINLTSVKDHYGHEYNYKTGKIQEHTGSMSIPNISYKLQF